MSEGEFICDSCFRRKHIDDLRAVTAGLMTLRTCADCVSRESDPEEQKRRKR